MGTHDSIKYVRVGFVVKMTSESRLERMLGWPSRYPTKSILDTEYGWSDSFKEGLV